MRRNHFIILIFALAALSSCSKFLSESSRDEVRPTTTSDLNSLLIGTAYPYKAILDSYIDLLTDDIQCNGLPRDNAGQPMPSFNTHIQSGSYLFRFDPMMFDQIEITLKGDQNSWFNYFKLINGCNLILDYVGNVTGGEEEKRKIQGEAYFLRAYYYMKLVNIYGRPYDEATSDPAVNPAVPLIVSSKVSDERLSRNSVKEIYDQIEKDLLLAEALLAGETNPGQFRIGNLAPKALLSRMYLYKGSNEDLVKVVKYANEVIEAKPSLTLLTSYFTATTFSPAGIYDPAMSQEVIWNYGNNPNTSNLLAQSPYFPWASNVLNKLPPFCVSDQLLSLYERGTDNTDMKDLRYTAYFSKYSNGGVQLPYRTGKIDPNNANMGSNGIRTAEMFLNRAEAIIRLNLKGSTLAGNLQKATDDINTLRASRYDTRNTAYQPIQITNADDLWTFYKEERRRELCLEEGHRWFDIRRWRVPVQHRYIDINDQTTDVELAAGSLLYALPIPYPAMDANASLIQNPR